MTRAEFEAEISIPYMKAMKMMTNAPTVEQQQAPTADATPEAAPSQAEANIGLHHVNHAVIAARKKDDMNTVYNMIQSGDKEGLTQMVEDGEAIFIPAGSACYMVKSADFFTNWQIRVSGESGLWWVSVSDLDKAGN
jgi:hypothetical protein